MFVLACVVSSTCCTPRAAQTAFSKAHTTGCLSPQSRCGGAARKAGGMNATAGMHVCPSRSCCPTPLTRLQEGVGAALALWLAGHAHPLKLHVQAGPAALACRCVCGGGREEARAVRHRMLSTDRAAFAGPCRRPSLPATRSSVARWRVEHGTAKASAEQAQHATCEPTLHPSILRARLELGSNRGEEGAHACVACVACRAHISSPDGLLADRRPAPLLQPSPAHQFSSPAHPPESGPNMGWVHRMSTSGGSSRSSRRLGNSFTLSTSTNSVLRLSRCTGSAARTCAQAGGRGWGRALGWMHW